MNLRICTLGLIATLALVLCNCNRVPEKSPSDSSATNEVFSSTPPFKTLEPERYQALRIVTVTTPTGTSEIARTLIAKDGSLRREETLGPSATAYLYLPRGTFLLIPEARLYSESTPVVSSTPGSISPDESSELMLHGGGTETLYRQIGYEDVAGRRLQKYQIVVNRTDVANVTHSDTLVWVDEELGMPVKTEIRSSNGSRTVIELTEIKREVDARLLQIPEGYRKVTPEEARQALSRK